MNGFNRMDKRISLTRAFSGSRVSSAIMILMLVLLLTGISGRSAAVFASETDPQLPETVTLKIVYIVDGAQFHLYRVADFSETGEYTPNGDFAAYKSQLPTIHAEDQAGWLALAQTLAGYAAADSNIHAVDNQTVADGSATFKPVKPGLYLLVSDGLLVGYEIFHSSPMLVSLPFEKENDVWKSEATVDAKPGLSELTGDKISYSATKVWKNVPDGEAWPESVTVELLKDGEKIDGGVKTLSADNDWSATWEALDEGHTYTLTELNVPEGYTVEVTEMNRHFTVTNTRGDVPPGEKTPPPETTPPTEPSTNPPTTPPGTPTKPGGGTSSFVNKLTPKTGDDTPIDRWLMLLCAAGLVMIVGGCKLERSREN